MWGLNYIYRAIQKDIIIIRVSFSTNVNDIFYIVTYPKIKACEYCYHLLSYFIK